MGPKLKSHPYIWGLPVIVPRRIRDAVSRIREWWPSHISHGVLFSDGSCPFKWVRLSTDATGRFTLGFNQTLTTKLREIISFGDLW